MCRRWRRLSLSPLLLSKVSARLHDDLPADAAADEEHIACLRSLCAWLGQHAAGHVRSLDLELCPYEELPLQPRSWRQEAHALVSSALEACGAGGLQALSLHGPYGLEFGGWVDALHALHTLRLSGMACTEEGADDPADAEDARANNVCITAPLHALSMLHTAVLASLTMDGLPADALPPSLTLLSLQDVELPWELPVRQRVDPRLSRAVNEALAHRCCAPLTAAVRHATMPCLTQCCLFFSKCAAHSIAGGRPDAAAPAGILRTAAGGSRHLTSGRPAGARLPADRHLLCAEPPAP